MIKACISLISSFLRYVNCDLLGADGKQTAIRQHYCAERCLLSGEGAHDGDGLTRGPNANDTLVKLIIEM